MLRLNYSDENLLNHAFKAIDSNESFSILVTGWQVRILKKSIPMYIEYFYKKDVRNEKKKKTEILKFAPFGILTSTLWGIINKAILNEMTINYNEENDTLIIFIEIM
jgi:hypothetical protein